MALSKYATSDNTFEDYVAKSGVNLEKSQQKQHIRISSTGKPFSAGKGAKKVEVPIKFKKLVDDVILTEFSGHHIIKEKLQETHAKIGNYSLRSYDNSQYLVRSLKNAGFPDLNKINASLEKKGYTLDEGWQDDKGRINEEQFNNLFWDDVRITAEELEQKYPGFAVVGRTGGWWGINADEIESYVDIFVNYNKILKQMGPNATYDDIYEYVQGHQDNVLGNITLQEGAKLKALDLDLNSMVKHFESTDRWVEQLIENNYATKN